VVQAEARCNDQPTTSCWSPLDIAGSVTDRSWTGKQSGTFTINETSGELELEHTGAVTVGPLPQAVNNTNGTFTFSQTFRSSYLCIRKGVLFSD
jgi:hypothetical protein